MDSRPLLGRSAPSSPKAKYHCKRRPMAKLFVKLRDAMSHFRDVFHSHNTGWEDSVEYEVKKIPLSSSLSFLEETREEPLLPRCKDESYECGYEMTDKNGERGTIGTDDCAKIWRRNRGSVILLEEETMQTCEEGVTAEGFHSKKKVRFVDDVEQPLASNLFVSEQDPLGLGGPVSLMRLNLTAFASSWHAPLRRSLIALKDGVQNLATMFPSSEDRRGAFPTAEGAFPSFVTNSHTLN